MNLIKFQELRCKEDELRLKQIQQHETEQKLRKQKEELDAREFEILERELQMMIIRNTPQPLKRRGKFSKSKLKVNTYWDQNGLLGAIWVLLLIHIFDLQFYYKF